MAGHHITICKKCKKVINQCRCDSKDKALIESICEECKNDEIVEVIKKGCFCNHCHGDTKSPQTECACTEECKTLTQLQDREKTASQLSASNINTPYEALVWLTCANLAEALCLYKKAFLYRNTGIKAYEKIWHLHDAQKWSEIFGFTELVEYYQKLIDIKGRRPK